MFKDPEALGHFSKVTKQQRKSTMVAIHDDADEAKENAEAGCFMYCSGCLKSL